ncbi:MAG: phosphoribosyl-ATP pyrophosphatase [Flavobacteriaceae bacterium]|jgi:hypothetical protein|nr:phosphoribosyl-ATP pyrophosphatase [Flavobacteriaceae bacterium]
MSLKYSSLKELRTKKEFLKKDISELEDIIVFKNPKETLSAITHGFTDPYLTEEIEDGETKISLNTRNIVKEISTKIKDRITKNSVLNFSKSDTAGILAENTLKIIIVSYIGKLARKSLASSNWKVKAMGFAMIYLVPIILKSVRKKLEDYQKNKTISGLEQII